MKKRTLQSLLTLMVFTSAALLVLAVRADLQEQTAERQDLKHESDRDGRDNKNGRRDHGNDSDHGLVQLPTGQFVTPTALEDAVQQYLNPGLPDTRTSLPARPCGPGSARTVRRSR